MRPLGVPAGLTPSIRKVELQDQEPLKERDKAVPERAHRDRALPAANGSANPE